ncbi:MAG: hypothetical protein ACP5HU_00865 [Phycisphaerae bacterium]
MTIGSRGMLVVCVLATFASAGALHAQQSDGGDTPQRVYAKPFAPDWQGDDPAAYAQLELRKLSMKQDLPAAQEALQDSVDELATQELPTEQHVQAVVEHAERVAELKRDIHRLTEQMAAIDHANLRPLRYVPCDMNLAVWRRPAQFINSEWSDRYPNAEFAEFSRPSGEAGTVHPSAWVAYFSYGGRRIALAVDSENAESDVLTGVRLDMSGRGDFSDLPLLPFRDDDAGRFGPAVTMMEIDGELVPFLAWGGPSYSGRDPFAIRFDGYLAAEGLVEIAGKECPVRIIDSSRNWKLGDRPQPEWDFQPYFSGDSLAIETGDGHFENPETVLEIWYGQPVEMDGRLYDIRLREDGKELRARELPADSVGTVRVAGATSFWGILISKDYVLNISSGDDAAAMVPAGEYIVVAVGATTSEGESSMKMQTGSEPETIVVPSAGTFELEPPPQQQ